MHRESESRIKLFELDVWDLSRMELVSSQLPYLGILAFVEMTHHYPSSHLKALERISKYWWSRHMSTMEQFLAIK